MNRLRTLDLPADRMEGEVVAALFFRDQRPLRGPAALLDWRLNGKLTELLLTGAVRGLAGEQVLMPNNGKLVAERVLFVGGGSWQELGPEAYRVLVGDLLRTCREAGFWRIALCLSSLAGADAVAIEEMVGEVLAGVPTVGERELECLLTITESGAPR